MEIYKITIFLAKKEDCVYYQKGNDIITYGMRLFQENVRMGLVNHWYGMQEEKVQTIYKKLSEQILNYDGENWIDKSAEE